MKHEPLENFNRLQNTDRGYGHRLVIKPSKKKGFQEGGVEETENFTVERNPDGSIKNMTRKGKDNKGVRFNERLPEGFTKERGFADAQENKKFEESNDFVDPVKEFGPTEEQRGPLRDQLEEMGIQLKSDEEIDMGRRRFLKRGAVAVGAAAATATGVKMIHDLVSETTQEIENTEEDPEKTESIEESENLATFENELEGYKAFMQLRKDEVLFVDEYNRPVGEPQKFEDFIVDREATSETDPDHIRPDGTVPYKLTPGKMNEIGIPEEGVAGEWLGHVRTEVQAEHPEQKIVESMNVVKDFLAALNEDDEPELVAKIANGEVNTYLEIVKYFADKPVVGAEDLTRQEYVQTAIQFQEWNESTGDGVPPVVDRELRHLLPGLCAQESKFNAGLTSGSTPPAMGLMQFKLDTWIDEGGDQNEIKSLVEQVEIAGQYISKQYAWIQQFVGEEQLDLLRGKYPDENSFQRDLMVPLLVNAYNTGAGAISEVVKSYIDDTEADDMPSGKELFLDIANFGERAEGSENLKAYGKDAREYVTKIYAQAEVLNKK